MLLFSLEATNISVTVAAFLSVLGGINYCNVTLFLYWILSLCHTRGEAKGDRQKSDQKRPKTSKTWQNRHQKVTKTEKRWPIPLLRPPLCGTVIKSCKETGLPFWPKFFTDRLKKYWGFFWDVGNFYRCRLQIPRNFGSVICRQGSPLCLLNNAKAPIGMTDLKIKRIFWGIGFFFTVADFKFSRICLVNVSVGMVHYSNQFHPAPREKLQL